MKDRNIYNQSLEERIKRAEESEKNRKAANITNYNKTEIASNKKTKDVVTKRGKSFLKGAAITSGIVLGMAGVTKIVIGKVEDIKKQKEVDKGKISMTDYLKEEKITYGKGVFEGLNNFYEAIDDYKNAEDIYETAKAQVTIVDYMKNGNFESASKAAIELKLTDSVLYGNFDKANKKGTKVFYIDGQGGDSDMIRIKGIDGKYYSMSNFDILSKDMPDNLKELAEDIFELQDNPDWKSPEECVKVAIEMSEDLENVVQENYLLDKKGNIKIVTNKEFAEAKNRYMEKVREKQKESADRISEKYGINVLSNKKDTIEIEYE